MLTTQRTDETELANQIAKEIITDIESYVNDYLEKYEKYTLNAPQTGASLSGNKFFELISSLKDVSILGRILLESAPEFMNAQKPQVGSSKSSTPNSIPPSKAPNNSPLSFSDRKISTGESSAGQCGNSKQYRQQQQQTSDGNISASGSKIDEDATSEDLLAALIESSSSDDFLVLSSSLESITIKDMMLAVFIFITSHECFTLSHDIQGVVMVLRRTKFMILNILAPRNQMELITKMLTSISRYSEMNYVFDLFRDRNQFEMLLSKGVEKTPELRIALFYYVKKNPEFYDLVTLNFSMFREIAESLEANAIKRLDRLIAASKKKKQGRGRHNHQQQPEAANEFYLHSVNDVSLSSASSSALLASSALISTTSATQTAITTSTTTIQSVTLPATSSAIAGVASAPAYSIQTAASSTNASAKADSNMMVTMYSKESLNLSLVELVDASDCFAKAGCYKRSNYCEQKAKLIALQLALLPTGTNVLGLAQSELNGLIVGFESFAYAYIVAEAYNYHLAWRQALFRNVILRAQSAYLSSYCKKCDLSSVLVEELVLLYKQYINGKQLSHEESSNLASGLKLLLARLVDVELKCKIYSQLNFDDAKEELLRDPATQAHLKDLKLA